MSTFVKVAAGTTIALATAVAGSKTGREKVNELAGDAWDFMKVVGNDWREHGKRLFKKADSKNGKKSSKKK